MAQALLRLKNGKEMNKVTDLSKLDGLVENTRRIAQSRPALRESNTGADLHDTFEIYLIDLETGERVKKVFSIKN